MYENALEMYYEALAVLDSSSGFLFSILLSNRSACLQNLGDHTVSAFDSAMSILIRPFNIKTHYRRASSLLHLDKPQAALSACDFAKVFFPIDKQIDLLIARANRVLSAKSLTIISPRSTVTEK
jgi:stress-induced-phosphoprotein 1